MADRCFLSRSRAEVCESFPNNRCRLNLFSSSDGRLRPAWRFLLCIPTFFLTEFIAGLAAAPFAPHPLIFEAIFRPLHLVLLLAVFSVMLRVLDQSSGPPLPAQGLPFCPPALRDLICGLALGAGLIALAVLVIAAKGGFESHVLFAPRFARLLADLWILATAAMLEEVAFRGYPFQRLVEAVGPVLATILLSLAFGAIHMNNPHASWIGALNTALVGVLFSIAYLRRRTLWFPFGIHFAWNLTMGVIFGLPVSGITKFAVVVAGASSGPTWLTGGAYGIEASLTGTAVILLGIAMVLLLFPDRGNPLPNSVTGSEELGI